MVVVLYKPTPATSVVAEPEAKSYTSVWSASFVNVGGVVFERCEHAVNICEFATVVLSATVQPESFVPVAPIDMPCALPVADTAPPTNPVTPGDAYTVTSFAPDAAPFNKKIEVTYVRDGVVVVTVAT